MLAFVLLFLITKVETIVLLLSVVFFFRSLKAYVRALKKTYVLDTVMYLVVDFHIFKKMYEQVQNTK